MKNRIGYLFLVAGTFYLLVMYAAKVFLLLLLLELIFPLFQLFFLLLQTAGLRIRWNGGGEELSFCLENRGTLPLLKLSVRTVVTHPWSGTVRKIRKKFIVNGRSSQEVSFPPGQLPYGRSEVRVEHLRLWDYLGIFSLSKRVKFCKEIYLLPEPVPVELSISGRTWSFRTDGDTFSKDKPGEDPAEVFGLREYQPGDRLQRVHWKLSARSEDWMVRELSLAEIPRVLFLLDLYRVPGLTEAQCSAFLTAVFSISQAMALEGCCHEFGWFVPDENAFQLARIQEPEQVWEAGKQLMKADLYDASLDLFELCRAEGRLARYAGILRLTMGLELIYGETPVGKLSAETIKESLSHCGLEV